jgi:hypothetical protein
MDPQVVSVDAKRRFGLEGCCYIYGKEPASESGRYKALEKSGKKGGCRERVDRTQRSKRAILKTERNPL